MSELPQVVAALKASLRFLADAGCPGFDCSRESLKKVQGWGKGPVTAKQKGLPSVTETLADIRSDLGECRRCKLHRGRTHIVFGEGAADARIVFVGEGPGYHEDQKGRPFVGEAGQLLDKILAAMNLSRDRIYIGNIIKCRPPHNRDPLPDEIARCFPFLRRQLAAIGPEYICALGTFAAQTLLETKTPISELRGRFHDYGGIKLLCTYHPAYLLRNPGQKRAVWEDMKQLMADCGLRPRSS